MKDKKVRVITTLKEVRVLTDPYRQEILKTIGYTDKPMTAKDIAVAMKEPPSKVNYHVGILYKHDFIELDHTKTINGIVAKFYVMPANVIKIQLEGKNAKSNEISAIRDIVSSVYDSARDVYITQVAKSMENKLCENEENINNEIDNVDLLLSQKVYLTEADRIELGNFFERVSKNKVKSEDSELHNLFISFIKLDE